MASITSPGLGSGLDVNSIVTQLVALEGQPTSDRLNRREAELQARLSAYGTLRSSVESFQGALGGLASASSFRAKTASSSDTEVLVATANEAAALGSYDLEVGQLAEAHSLVTDSVLAAAQFTSLTDNLGTGTLTFKFGTTVYDPDTDTYTSFTLNPEVATASVQITDGSLSGIRDAINEADIGVSASIIFDGSHYRLALNAAETGAVNSLEISVADDDTNDADASGLSLLSFNSAANHLVQTNAAQDAQLTVNGLAVTSASNTLSETIDGLTVTLLGSGSSQVKVEQNTASVGGLIEDFVNSYNELIKGINDLTRFDPETRTAGVLNGDAVVRGIKAQVERLMTTPIEGVTGRFSILAEIGIERSSSDGTLSIDNAKLQDAIRDNFDDVVDLFAANGRTTDALIGFSGFTESSAVGSYGVNITQLATQGDLVGSAAANLTITAGVNDTVSFDVDGLTGTLTLTAGAYTAAGLAAELQTRINGLNALQEAGAAVSVSESAGVLTITSNRYGAASKVEVTGGNGASDLLGATPTETTGLDVAGSIGSTAATGSGQTLTGNGSASGLAIEVAGGALGDRGSLTFTRGFADQMDELLTGLLESDGIFTSISKTLNDRISNIDDDREALARRLDSYEQRLRAQFGALDLLVSQLQSTSAFLSQQLASLPVIGSNRDADGLGS